MLTHVMPGGRAYRHSLWKPGDPRSVSRKTQFSLFQNIDDGTETFLVKLYLKFHRSPDHEQRRLRMEEPALQVEDRTVSASDLRVSLDSALESVSFRAEVDAVPFPVGLGYGPLWTGATRVRVSVTAAGGYRFRVQIEGALKWLQSWDDIHENDDAGTFAINSEIPFEGVWIQTEHPDRKDAVVASFRSVFAGHAFAVEMDEFTDAFVLRAGP